MKKRGLGLLMAYTMAVSMLAGCSGGKADSTDQVPSRIEIEGKNYNLADSFISSVKSLVGDGHYVMDAALNKYGADGYLAEPSEKFDYDHFDRQDGQAVLMTMPPRKDTSLLAEEKILQKASFILMDGDYKTIDGITGASEAKDLDANVNLYPCYYGLGNETEPTACSVWMDRKRVDLKDYIEKLDEAFDSVNDAVLHTYIGNGIPFLIDKHPTMSEFYQHPELYIRDTSAKAVEKARNTILLYTFLRTEADNVRSEKVHDITIIMYYSRERMYVDYSILNMQKAVPSRKHE